jgi:hypothetical protein
MMTVGVLSKSAIYGTSGNSGYNPLMAIVFLQSDSIGTFYNLNELYDAVTNYGAGTHGRMLGDTTLNLIPGAVSRDYANFQIGQIVTSRQSVVIGGEIIGRSVSLSATMVGGPFADFGWAGVAVTGVIAGGLWALFEEVAVARRWYAGFFAYWMAEMFSAIYGGPYNDSLLLVTIMCVGLLPFAMPGRRPRLFEVMGQWPGAQRRREPMR